MPTSAPAVAPDVATAAARIGRRLSGPTGTAAWTPPPLPDLIARIDDVLAARRGV